MAHHDQIRALMPEVINGKTHDQLREEMVARDKAMGARYLDGVKMPWFMPQSNFDALETFEVRPDDLLIVTYPRSGTHWTGEISQLILHDDENAIDRTLMSTGLETTVTSDPSLMDSTVPGYKLYEAMESPRVMLTHCRENRLPPQVWTKQTKVLYVIRNPKDVSISLYGIFKASDRLSISSFDEFLWLFYFGETIWGSWFDHVLSYWKHKDDPNFLFLKYEDLHRDLRGSICKLAKHVERDLSDDVINGIVERVTFGGMQKTFQKLEEVYGEEGRWMTHGFGNMSAPYLRKGRVGGWKDTFTVAQNALFDKVYVLKMEGSGLDLDFEL